MRELVTAAATAGDYEAVLRLTEMARTLAEMASLGSSPPGGVTKRSTLSPRDAPRMQPNSEGKGEGPRGKPASRARQLKQYPLFFRRRNWLVKIGWSKREKAEYEHRAPRKVARLLAAALAQKGAKGKLVSFPDILPLVDAAEDADVPSYQAYLCLAWFRRCALVEQKGRKGYVIPNAHELCQRIDAQWEELPAEEVG